MGNKICDMGLLSLLRFLASIIVVLFHCRTRSPFLGEALRIFSAGPQMVTFFFVLSGFSLMLAYYGKKEFSYKEYWTNRAVKIVPVYLVGIVLALIVNPFVDKPFSFTGLLLHLTFTHALVPPHPLSINGPAWFMSVVVVFYAIFPLILSVIKKWSPKPALLFASVLLLWFVTQAFLSHLLDSGFYKGFPSVSHDLIYYFPLVHLGSFLIGVSAAYGVIVSERWRLSGTSAALLFFISLATVTLVIENQAGLTALLHHGVPFGSSFYAPFFLLVILSCSMLQGRFKQILSMPIFGVLGEISFAVYMIQIPVRGINSFLVDGFPLSYDVRMLIFLVVLISLGSLLTFKVERPIRNYVKKNRAVLLSKQPG
jgi:peptidoglycan/LPS O-acetylase OafA/YrhL